MIGNAPMTCPIIRIDTNQGISGYGEVRDGASKTYALLLKSRLVGENPCNVDKVFRKIKQFGHHARQAGGVCAVEMACWDLAGKAFGVPVYQMLGGQFRNRVRLYADTDQMKDGVAQGKRLKERMDLGITYLKMDFGIELIRDVPGALSVPIGQTVQERAMTMHPFTGVEITDKGIALLEEYVGGVRSIVGMEVPLSTDHFGHIGVNSCIKLARAMEKWNLAWMEDMVPWQLGHLMKQIADNTTVPILTGEDIYLKEDFVKLIDMGAVDAIHPDLASAGGILETKKIGDYAMEHGVPMAMHFAGSPISFMANVHCAAATENFISLEHHSLDVPWWGDLVTPAPWSSRRASRSSPTAPASASSRTPTWSRRTSRSPATSSPRRSGTRSAPGTGSGADIPSAVPEELRLLVVRAESARPDLSFRGASVPPGDEGSAAGRSC